MAAIREDKSGMLTDIYDNDSGRLSEAGTTNKWEFFQEGATVDRKLGDGFVYVKVTTPTGKVIITEIKNA